MLDNVRIYEAYIAQRRYETAEVHYNGDNHIQLFIRDVYRQIYGRRSRYMAPLVCPRKTKFLTIYEGHPIKNETFFIVRKSVCVFNKISPY